MLGLTTGSFKQVVAPAECMLSYIHNIMHWTSSIYEPDVRLTVLCIDV